MTARPPPWSDLWAVFGRIGLLSFGGPAAQIALMHRELVERRPWLTEDQFLRGLAYCTLLPGPEAMQLATHAGWRLRGTAGGLLAGLLFVLPGAAVVVALAAVYVAYGEVAGVEAAFVGVQAAVLAIVAQALWRLAGKALAGRVEVAVAGLAFLALFALGAPFWAVLLAAGAVGLTRPQPSEGAAPGHAPLGATIRTVALWLAVWWAPLLALIALAPGTPPAQAAVFFSWLATVSFGGAYAVLAALTQTAVEGYGWLTAEQMIDGLGLAETTPGPLILVTVFVSWLGGAAGGWPMAAATAAVTLWATFVPCFLWIFAGSPHLEALTAQPRLRGALRTIQAAVVGVMASLALWFALHVLFLDFAQGAILPRWGSLDPRAAGLAVLAGLMLGPLGRGVVGTLAACAAAALALAFLA
jgi:chromate transporter